MSSYSIDEFAGEGALKEILDALTADGWDDVPTLKMMRATDMESLNLTAEQRDALELRSYLHDRNLMQYADKLELSGKRLPELLVENPAILASQYEMKRGHVARFVDRSTACGIVLPANLTQSRKAPSVAGDDYSDVSSTVTDHQWESSDMTPKRPTSVVSRQSNQSYDETDQDGVGSDGNRGSSAGEKPIKGIVGNLDAPPRFCGFVRPVPVGETVAPLSILEKINVQKLTPELKRGSDPWASGEIKLPPPIKASDLWATKPVLLICIRRPGCVMCRAEAHQLYARKPIFDSLGIQLVAVLNQNIDSEVKAFWPRYWGGITILDLNKDFFKALGGGVLLKDNLLTGFLLNSIALRNWKRATSTGFEYNTKGEGTVKGGLFVIGAGKMGVAYQFAERTFGDWAPMEEVLTICSKVQIPSKKAQAKSDNLPTHEEESLNLSMERM